MNNNHSSSQNADLKSELDELQLKFEKHYKELVLAQKKRSGHYKKLEYQLVINKKLKNRIADLESILEDKNSSFIKLEVDKRFNDLKTEVTDSYILDKLIEEVSQNTLTEQKLKLLISENTLQKKTINQQKQKITELTEELKIAQEKRAGHYKKLEYEINEKHKLIAKVDFLSQAEERLKKTLTWSLGKVLLEARTLKGFFLLPYNIVKANKSYRKNKAKKTELMNLDNGSLYNNTEQSLVFKNSEQSQYRDISILGWPSPTEDKPLTIMNISDAFTTSNLKSVANLIQPRPDNWLGLLDRDKPEMLFVESAWNGNENSWQYRIGNYTNPPGKELFDVIKEFKGRGIPTIFWNKEDPVHFDKFHKAAQEFDYIFTSDQGSVAKYKEISKAKVFPLPFSADAEVNNPIGSYNRENKVCFAGSFYANRFSERKDDQIMLLESALPYGLEIYDRNYNNSNRDFRFPEQFNSSVKGVLSYDEMNKAYKKYKIFLNVNSVIDSKTMFSRRVFELLASGTPIISTPSLGIEEFFGTDLIWLVKNREEAQQAIYTLLNDDDEWLRRSIQGIRKVFLDHTFKNRFQFILDKIDMDISLNEKRTIMAICEAYTQQDIDDYEKVIEKQVSCHMYEVVPCVVMRKEKLQTQYKAVFDERSKLTDLIKSMILELNVYTGYVSYFSKNKLYGKNYLIDLCLSTLYNKANIITKPDKQQIPYEYTNSFLFDGSLIKVNLFDKSDFLQCFSDRQVNVIRTTENVFVIDAANYADITSNKNAKLLEI